MNLRAGYPYWLIRDGLPYSFPKLSKDITTDVLIIGAGITGALVRYELCEQGVDCVTVDARTIGLGSTCASTALLQYEIDTRLFELREMIGKQKADRAYHLCNDAILYLSKLAKKLKVDDFKMRDSLYYAAYKKDVTMLKKEFDARSDAGFDVEWLDSKMLKSKFGFDAPAAILSHHGAETNAYAMMHALLQTHKKSPVFDRTNVVKTDYHKNGIAFTTESGQTIKCSKVIYATGYEVVELIDAKIVKLLSTYALVSEHHPTKSFWKGNALIWNTADPYLYMRSTPEGRILVGGRDEDFYNPTRRDKLIGRKTKQLVKDFNKIFPEIELIPEFSWAGTFGSTKDGLPYIGPYSKMPHSYFALGFGGNGITFSAVAAKLLADLITGKESPDLQLFSFDRE